MPGAEWLLADACELATLEEAALQSCDVVVAATGDDKVNLVVSLLAKTEFGVPRVVARVNHPKNEWLFNESWGVDVAVSHAAADGRPGRGGGHRRRPGAADDASGRARPTSSSSRCPPDAPLVGQPRRRDPLAAATPRWSRSCASGRVLVPAADDPLEAGDELLFVGHRRGRGRAGRAPVAAPIVSRRIHATPRPAVPVLGPRRLGRPVRRAGPRPPDGRASAGREVRRPRTAPGYGPGQQPTMAASAATCSGQPSAIFAMPRR